MNSLNFAGARLDAIASLKDAELLATMKRIASAERALTIYALAHLAEIQR